MALDQPMSCHIRVWKVLRLRHTDFKHYLGRLASMDREPSSAKGDQLRVHNDTVQSDHAGEGQLSVNSCSLLLCLLPLATFKLDSSSLTKHSTLPLFHD